MILKRPFPVEEEGEPGFGPSVQMPKRRLASASSFSPEEVIKVLEPLLRIMVREAIDRVLSIYFGSPSASSSIGEAAGLRLRFATKLPSMIFTGNKVQTEDNSRVVIELIDSRTNSRVTTGPLSSLKIDILVLYGDFDSDDSENWTENDFKDKIAREREGRKPLITGDLTVTLNQGLGCLGSVTFTDNSSWIPCGKFRLGARVSPKCRVGERVREASSGAFFVKDQRGKFYQKHHPPYPNDEVWRLKQISKVGKFCSRLGAEGIHTVKDFLRLYETNPSLLKKILSGDGTTISNRTWESIIGHATDCKIDGNEMYIYSSPGLTNPEILFDQVFRVVGATFDGREYCPVEKLTVPRKILVQNLKWQAFENLDRLTPVPAGTFLVPQGTTLESQFCYEASGTHFLEVSEPQNYHPGDVLPPTVTGSFTMVDNMCPEGLNGADNFVTSSTISAGADHNDPRFHVPTIFPSTSSWTPEDFSGLFGESELGIFTCFPSNFSLYNMGSSNEASFGVHFNSTSRSRAAWCKIRAAFKWRSVGRDLAARRQQVFCL